MAYPANLVRTKDWGTEIMIDADLEGQLDLIITWLMAFAHATTGHKHDATANEGPKILVGGLANDAVETAIIKNANVTAAKLATDAVETAKIKAANVTTAKIALLNITAALLAANAVETVKIKDANVTYAKFASALKERIVKCWISFTGTGVIAIDDSYNVSGIVDNNVGDYTVTWDTDFANDTYSVVFTHYHASASQCQIWAKAAGTVQMKTNTDGSSNALDATKVHAIAIGDQ